MRKVLGFLVILCGIVSIAMTARYGWKQADNEIDQAISAAMFGTIALCAIIFDAVAIRLWLSGWRKAGGFIGLIACLAFVVTFSNSLGSISSRSDAVEAQRQTVTDTRADNRRELDRLEDALARIGTFTPTDQAAVEAATRAANTATDRRKAECGENNEKRGPLCRQREAEDAAAATHLATTTASKSTTDRARDLESQIAKVKAELGNSKSVGAVNPLAHALSQIIPGLGKGIGSKMQATIAFVFELCIIGMMLGYEVMAHATPNRPSAFVREAKVVIIPPAPQPRLITRNPGPPVGSVKRILTDHLESAPGDSVEIADIGNRYRAVCRRDGKRMVTQDEFAAELDDFCRTVGIKRKKAGKHLYLRDVRLASVLAPAEPDDVMA